MRGECHPFSLEDIKAYLLILKRKKTKSGKVIVRQAYQLLEKKKEVKLKMAYH